MSPEGVSYTEKEFQYAIEKKIPVLAFLHEKPEDLPASKTDLDQVARAKLEAFRERVKKGRLVKFWTKAEELPGLVALSLPQTIKIYPAVGWVRANQVANTELLTQLNELRKRNQELESPLAKAVSRPRIDDLAGLDEHVNLEGYYETNHKRYSWQCRLTWGDVFAMIAPYLFDVMKEAAVKSVLERSLPRWVEPKVRFLKLDDQVFQTVKIQLMAHGLVELTTTGSFWILTSRGKEMVMQLRTVRRADLPEVTDQELSEVRDRDIEVDPESDA